MKQTTVILSIDLTGDSIADLRHRAQAIAERLVAERADTLAVRVLELAAPGEYRQQFLIG